MNQSRQEKIEFRAAAIEVSIRHRPQARLFSVQESFRTA